MGKIWRIRGIERSLEMPVENGGEGGAGRLCVASSRPQQGDWIPFRVQREAIAGF